MCPMPRLFRVLLVVFASLSVTTLAQVRYRPTETGPWRPWSFTAVNDARQSRGATAAEVQAFQTRLQELAAIIKKAPGVSPPIGFAGEMWGSLSSYHPNANAGQPAGRAVPLAGELRFAAFQLIEYERNGKTVNEDLKGGETETLGFTVNQLDGFMYRDTVPDGLGETDAFVEPASGAAVAGVPRIGDVYVVRKNQKPLWVPFAIGDALQPIATKRREEYEQRRDVYAKAVAEFTEWKTPAKRAARKEEWKKSAASMPAAQASQFLAMMEKNEPQIEAMNETRLAAGGSEDKSVRAAQQELQEVDGLLAALSPDARRAASCYDQRASKLGDRFRLLAGAPASCRPLVRPNFDYFDPKLPRSAPQVVMLADYTRCLKPEVAKSTLRGGCVINKALVESMDWDAVRAWLDR